MRILIVEDHRDSAEMLGRALGHRGHEVETAFTGSEAVLACNDHSFDVLIADIGLPDIDGWELLRRIRVKAKRSIALSGYAMACHIEKSKVAGFDAHLAKPVDLALLIRTMDSLSRDAAQEKSPVG
jgi:CheY-like chemotaxis protein